MGGRDDAPAQPEGPTAPVATFRGVARGRVTMLPATVQRIVANEVAKGDVLGTARYAGTQAAKGSSTLIPVAAGAPPPAVTLQFELHESHVDIVASVDDPHQPDAATHGLVAVGVAALTIYDMCKSADRTMSIGEICPLHTAQP